MSNDEVHLWRASIDPGSASLEPFEHLIAHEERLRAKRFKFDRDRARYTICRGILRILLARYMACDPADVCLRYGEYGKPFVDETRHSGAPCFNVSHSAELAVYAFARDRRVGVDVERLDGNISPQEMVSRFLPGERVGALEQPSENDARLFLRRWTEKEARVKADGRSLAVELDKSEQTRDTVVFGSSDSDLWYSQQLELGEEYVGCVVVSGHACTLRCYEWTSDRIS